MSFVISKGASNLKEFTGVGAKLCIDVVVIGGQQNSGDCAKKSVRIEHEDILST